MSPATYALALPALPNLEPVFALALAVLVGGAAVLLALAALRGWRALGRGTRAVDKLAERLASGVVTDGFAARRARLAELSALTERALWTLPEVDRRLALAGRQLADAHRAVDELGGGGSEHVREQVIGLRDTLVRIRTIGRIRRMVGR